MATRKPRGTDFPKPTFHSGVTTRSGDVQQLFDIQGNSSGHEKAFEDFLNSKGLTNISEDSKQALFDLLNGYSQSGNTSAERNDMFYQFLLQQIANQDQRSFDLSQLSDQRLYDSPTNQLARLMGAGISRDAAIQILQGVQGAGVAGSVGAAAPGVSAPSGTMQNQFLNSAINVFGAINTMLQSGVSLAQGIETIRMMQMQNYMSQQQIDAYNAVQQVSQQLQTLDASGKIKMADFSNADDVLKYIREHGDDEDLQSLTSSPSLAAALGTTFGREMFNRHWASVRQTRDSGTLLDQFIRQQYLQNAMTGVSIEKAGVEMEKLGAEVDLTYQNLIESLHRVAQIDANIEVLDETGKNIAEQTKWYGRKTASEIDLNQANASNIRVQTAINNDVFEVNHAGVPMLKEKYVLECQRALDKATVFADPKVRYQFLKAWAMEGYNAYAGAYLDNLYLNAAGSFATDNPNLWRMAVGWHEATGGNLVRESTGAAGTAVGAFGTILKAMPK